MRQRPPISSPTDTLVPYTTLFRSNAIPAGLSHLSRTPSTHESTQRRMPHQQLVTHQAQRKRSSNGQPKLQRPEQSQVHQQVLQRSEAHTSELPSLMRISYAVFCLKNNKQTPRQHTKS